MIFNRKKEASPRGSSIWLGRYYHPQYGEVTAKMESAGTIASTDWIIVFYYTNGIRNEFATAHSDKDAEAVLLSQGFTHSNSVVQQVNI